MIWQQVVLLISGVVLVALAFLLPFIHPNECQRLHASRVSILWKDTGGRTTTWRMFRVDGTEFYIEAEKGGQK